MTHQRRVVLQVLADSQEHLDAEAIHDLVKSREPRVSLATVYRTLGLLKNLGLIHEYKLGEEHGHFEAVQGSPHYHFTCLKCHTVVEFQAPELPEFVRPLLERQGMQVADFHLRVSGLCSNCKDS